MNRLIIGCGFLGWPLALNWEKQCQRSNDLPSGSTNQVFAMTRSATRADQFAAAGLLPIIADITKAEGMGRALADLPTIDTIVFAVGMDRSRYSDIFDVYVEGLRRFIESFPHPIKHLIYVSSTGVYGDFDGNWVDEDSPTLPAREGGKACLAAEALLAEATENWTVLRMAGLYGGTRVPTKTLIENRNWEKLSPHGFLNLIHQTDAVAAIAKAAHVKPMQEIILCSDGRPPVRKDYYQYIANQFGIGDIPWPAQTNVDPQSRSAKSKRISNDKMLKLLDLKLQYSDYKSGLAELF